MEENKIKIHLHGDDRLDYYDYDSRTNTEGDNGLIDRLQNKHRRNTNRRNNRRYIPSNWKVIRSLYIECGRPYSVLARTKNRTFPKLSQQKKGH